MGFQAFTEVDEAFTRPWGVGSLSLCWDCASDVLLGLVCDPGLFRFKLGVLDLGLLGWKLGLWSLHLGGFLHCQGSGFLLKVCGGLVFGGFFEVRAWLGGKASHCFVNVGYSRISPFKCQPSASKTSFC